MDGICCLNLWAILEKIEDWLWCPIEHLYLLVAESTTLPGRNRSVPTVSGESSQWTALPVDNHSVSVAHREDLSCWELERIKLLPLKLEMALWAVWSARTINWTFLSIIYTCSWTLNTSVINCSMMRVLELLYLYLFTYLFICISHSKKLLWSWLIVCVLLNYKRDWWSMISWWIVSTKLHRSH